MTHLPFSQVGVGAQHGQPSISPPDEPDAPALPLNAAPEPACALLTPPALLPAAAVPVAAVPPAAAPVPAMPTDPPALAVPA